MHLWIPRAQRAGVRDVRPLQNPPSSPPPQRPERHEPERDHRRAHGFVGVLSKVVEVHASSCREEDGADEGEAERVAASPLHAEHRGAERAAKTGAGAESRRAFVVVLVVVVFFIFRAVIAAAGFDVASLASFGRARGGDDRERDEVVGAHEHVQRAWRR